MDCERVREFAKILCQQFRELVGYVVAANMHDNVLGECLYDQDTGNFSRMSVTFVSGRQKATNVFVLTFLMIGSPVMSVVGGGTDRVNSEGWTEQETSAFFGVKSGMEK